MFVTYPDVRYLSGCSLPIRMFVTYPNVCYLSAWALVRLPSHPGLVPTLKVARNSSTNTSSFEITCPELQRFWAHSKTDRVKLRARFVGNPRRRSDTRVAPERHQRDARKASDLRERLLQVRNQILRVLQADRQAQERAGHSAHAAHARRVGHDRRVLDEGLRRTQ